jgi:hypothetical protein
LETTAKKIAMNKKLTFSLMAAAMLALAFTSCKKDVSEEELLKNQLAQTDSLLKRGGVIKYTVKLVSAAGSAMLKAGVSMEGAKVMAYQNDSMYTATTDANGFATFKNMRIGTVAVHVEMDGYSEVDYIADITPAESLINLSQTQVINTVRYASTMVPMFPIADPGCATITGKVTAELDLTNTTPEPAPGVKVTATVDVDDPDFVARYIAPTQGTTSSPSAGRILKYAFSNASVTATTSTDGTYTLKVPASVNGLPVKLSVADYQASQKLYLENDPATNTFAPGEYTVPVLFSSNLEPTPIPEVKPVYVVVDEPTAPIGFIYKNATLSFELDANGTITKVNVNDKGKYTTKPAIVTEWGSGTGAILDPIYNTITGEIDGINIISGGIGYRDDSKYRILLLKSIKTAKVVTAIDESGYIFNANFEDKGLGYIVKPNIRFIAPNINAIEPKVETDFNWNTELATIRITSPGKNYRKTLNFKSNSISYSINKEKIIATSDDILIKNIFCNSGTRF